MPGGRRFITAGGVGNENPAISLWDIFAARQLATSRMRSENELERVAVSDKVVAAIEWPGRVHAWDRLTGAPIQHFDDTSAIRLALALDPVKGRLVTLAQEKDGLAYVFDLATGKRTTIPGPGLTTVAYSDRRPYISSAVFDARGRALLRLIRSTNSPSSKLELWRLDPPALQLQLACEDATREIALSPCGDRIAWLVNGSQARIFSKAIEEPDSEWAADLPADDKSDVGVRLAFSQDGTRIVAATGSSIQVFDTKHGGSIGRRVDLPGRVMHIALELDKHGFRAVASLATFQQSVVDVRSGEILETHFFASDRVGDWSVVVADDETSVYSVFDDPNIKHPRVWSWRFNIQLVADAVKAKLQSQ